MEILGKSELWMRYSLFVKMQRIDKNKSFNSMVIISMKCKTMIN